mmetsp:Transcript_6962/g.12467  ORF Transcript_6962/g.12467 Transcript_6962/m.12467 type:complete len:376 (+) Transcript_6962:112-1239(+)|eukprot:CAMPEP_0201934522 /NCGR_PEP_ID=MMETSP0903-20130614/33773_1 /ASSEMBLY_ACC=CAM_ASM_000552 /TAXON_ID=420261 /ORGANISM="Thalassiosira antarctica, Strain CCMP982" /LENGTH=375 /DNA_ID=CAMNT_0048474755 /DNA_START=106 /DNA_END=1233 /DNA_ORIENTATION=-
MVYLKVAASLLAITALPSTHGFTSSSPRPPTRSAGQLHATDVSFERSLLEGQFENNAPAGDDDGTALISDHYYNEEPNVATSTTPAATSPSIENISTQNSILRIAASTDRGQLAKPSQKNTVTQLVRDLEYATLRNAPETTNYSASLESSTGTWELLYSNTQLFRSSPFFLAGRSTCKTPQEAAQYNWFCEMHRAALAISTIGVVRQVITSEGKLVNEFEVKVGAVPFLSDFLAPLRSYSGGLPLTINGAIVSTADATPISSSDWELFMDTVEIKGSNIPFLRRILDSGNVQLKSRGLSKVLEDNVESYEVPKPVLRTTYIDDAMRIVRDEDDNMFVYGRVSKSQEPTDYSGVMADLGVASLLEGFNDAVTKVYL